jgi:hypothetical protein
MDLDYDHQSDEQFDADLEALIEELSVPLPRDFTPQEFEAWD